MAFMTSRRSMVGGGLLAGFFASLGRPFEAIAATAAEDPYLRFVNPEMRGVAAAMLKMFADQAPLSQATLAASRMRMAGLKRPPLATIPWQRRQIAGLAGGPDVTVYIVNAKPGAHRPAILHTHGGGFVSGTAEAAIWDLQTIAAQLDCAAVSVDYRLAPETRFAGSIDDNYAGLKWLAANAAGLGVDPSRIAVMGESAGGGHAALLAIAARDRGEISIAFQCLIYPMLDDRTGSTRPVPPHVGRIVWDAADNRFGWQNFLGAAPGRRGVPPAGVPARTASLVGLPPTFIGVGSIDLFHDEDVEYARRLNDAAVPTELVVVPGAFHGFDVAAVSAPIVRWFNDAKVDALRRGLQTAGVAQA